jgi:hypothetical protein
MDTNRVGVSRLLKKLETEKRLLLYRNQIKLSRQRSEYGIGPY